MAVVALAVAVVSCGPGNQATLTIVDPVDGAILTLATDTQPDTAGVQTNVVVQAIGIAVGESVDLFLEDDSIVGTQTVPESGEVTFPDVTLPSGQHTLTAAMRSTDVRSNSVAIEVQDGCATINFVSPEAAGDRVTFGPSDDTDGSACDGSFETTVVIATDAGDGADARVFVNGTPRSTTTVAGTTARFTGVAFDIGSMANRLEVEVTNSDGVACRQAFGPDIFVDCEGVSCRITQPTTTGAFLNQSNDVSDAPGFQGDFEVTTDGDGAGQPVRLIIDGNETDALSATPMMVGTDGVASFGNVELSEGLHRIRAECLDGAGNPTRTSAEWTVDITPCAVAVTAPTEGALFNDTDDLDGSTAGIQIAVDGTADGDACTMVRTGHCDSLADFASFDGSSFSTTMTLGSSGMQELCAQVQDEAGNVGEARVNVRVRTDAPQLEITSPVGGTGYNSLGTGGRTADLDTGSTTCEATFTVNCTDVGATVTLIRESTGLMLPGGSATCTAVSGLPAPYLGQATFASVSLPSVPSLGTINVRASSEVDRLVGLSDPIALLADCEVPVISTTRPMCGSTLRPTDDEDPTTAGVQYRVDVLNSNSPKPPVALELRDSSGATVYGPVTSSTPTGGIVTSFAGTTFTVGGDVTIHVCASDAAGNTGCHDCTLSVQDIPTLAITEPMAGAVISSGADCDTSRAGLQLRVRATTNAASGSPATVQIGAASPAPASVSGTNIDMCIDAADGRNVPITVTVTDAVRGMASATVRVDIDTMPPPGPIDDLVLSEADRRGGIARFAWTAVDDAGGLRLDHYEARCASAPITSEAAWSAATPVTVGTSPGMAGAMQSANVMGFRPGQPRHCVIRGADIAGQLTPLPATPPAPYAPSLLQQSVMGSGGLGATVTALGDVSGDGIDDVLVAGTDGNAYLYFGSTGASPLGSSPSVTLAGPTTGGFGQAVASVGDVNGDGIGDFAISARLATVGTVSLAGAVWVIFGRPATSPWPSTITLNVASCGADICFLGGETGGLLGWALASAGDFDGDGRGDIAIGAFGGGGTAGKQYVVLGRAFTSGVTFTLPDMAPTPMNPDAFVVSPPAGVMRLGASAAAPGDFRGADGRTDLIVGASGNAPMSVLGRVYTLAGRAFPTGMSGLVTIATTDLSEFASGPGGNFGGLIRSIGDIDGNGRVDVAVSSSTGGSAGQVTVYRQEATGFSATSSFNVVNDSSNATLDLMGNSIGIGSHPFLGPLGDLDGDSMADLLVGSQERGASAGGIDFYYGTGAITTRMRSAADLMLEPTDPGTVRVAAYVGDLNGDGFNDIVVGDPGFMSNAGRFVLVY